MTPAKIMLITMLCILPLQAKPQSNDPLLQQIEHLTAQQRYQEAADHLEKYLLLHNSDPILINTYLTLLKIIDTPTTSSENNWKIRKKIKLQTSVSNNLNKAPSNKNITLTLPEGNLQAELAKNQRPQKGNSINLTAAINATKKIDSNNALNLSLQIEHRKTNKYNFTDYLRLTSGIGYWHKVNKKTGIDIALFSDILQYDNETRYYDVNLLSRYTWQYSKTCQPRIGINVQWQHQKDNSLFDSLYTGALLQTDCQWLKGYYTLALNLGNEFALSNRPGANKIQLRLSLEHNQALNFLHKKDRIKNSINIDYQQDSSGYSPFLNNNTQRTVHKITLASQYKIPLYQNQEQWWGIIKVEWQKQYSNLSLFKLEVLEAWLGIEVNW